MADFDPYHEWLGISPEERPINYYSLLSLRCFESNAKAISNAADRQMAFVRTFQTGPHAEESQRILNELAQARVTLLNPEQKAEYDAQLRKERSARAVPLPPPLPPLKRPEPPVLPRPKRPEPAVQSSSKRPEPPIRPFSKRPEPTVQSAPKRPEPVVQIISEGEESEVQTDPEVSEPVTIQIILNNQEPEVKVSYSQSNVSQQKPAEDTTAQGCCGCLFLIIIMIFLMSLF